MTAAVCPDVLADTKPKNENLFIKSLHEAGTAVQNCLLVFPGRALPGVKAHGSGTVYLRWNTASPWYLDRHSSMVFYSLGDLIPLLTLDALCTHPWDANQSSLTKAQPLYLTSSIFHCYKCLFICEMPYVNFLVRIWCDFPTHICDSEYSFSASLFRTLLILQPSQG